MCGWRSGLACPETSQQNPFQQLDKQLLRPFSQLGIQKAQSPGVGGRGGRQVHKPLYFLSKSRSPSPTQAPAQTPAEESEEMGVGAGFLGTPCLG